MRAARAGRGEDGDARPRGHRRSGRLGRRGRDQLGPRVTFELALRAAATAPAGSVNVLMDVVIVLGMCVVFGLVAERLGQSVLVGYLLAGVVVGGPSSLGLVDDIA